MFCAALRGSDSFHVAALRGSGGGVSERCLTGQLDDVSCLTGQVECCLFFVRLYGAASEGYIIKMLEMGFFHTVGMRIFGVRGPVKEAVWF